jgi:L-asparagine transporter-like permease
MATYVDRVLEPGESVRYRTTVSWIVYIPSVVLAAIALAALLVGIKYPDRDRVFWFVATISALVAMCNFAYAWFPSLDNRNRRHRSPRHSEARFYTPRDHGDELGKS